MPFQLVLPHGLRQVWFTRVIALVDLLQRIPFILKSAEFWWVVNNAALGRPATEWSLYSGWTLLNWSICDFSLIHFDVNFLFCPCRRLKQTVIWLIQVIVWARWDRQWPSFEGWLILVFKSWRPWQHGVFYMVARRHQSAQRPPALLVTFDLHVFPLVLLLFIFGISNLLLYLITHRV